MLTDFGKNVKHESKLGIGVCRAANFVRLKQQKKTFKLFEVF